MSSKESEEPEKILQKDESEEEKDEEEVVKKPVQSDEEFDSDDEKKKVDPAPSADYVKHLTYEGDKCIYTEPNSGRRMVYDNDKKSWCDESKPESQQETALPDVSQPDQNYEFDGQTYVYTDKNTNVTYKYDYEKKSWVVKDDSQLPSTTGLPEGGIYGFENDTHTYTDPKDGSVYIFDETKKAWFPKVDDDFLAMYQINYGFVDPKSFETTPEPKVPSKEEVAKKEDGKRKAPQPATWFEIDEAHNTSIYVSGLPLDVTLDEVTELFQKCGLLARDEKGKDKIKLYKDASGEPKGDALCTYIKIESVDLALNILDGWQIRGNTLSVQRAKFQLKGEYNPALKPKRRKKDKDKQKKIHERLFDWRPEKLPGEPQKCERVVVIKNFFKPEDFDKDVSKILELQQELRTECAENCGEVKKVTIYDRNPDGVAQVFFKEIEAAQACVELLNGRWFAQRRITAEIWDGKTKYKIAETDEQIEERLNKWEKYLEQEDEAKAAKLREENAAK